MGADGQIRTVDLSFTNSSEPLPSHPIPSRVPPPLLGRAEFSSRYVTVHHITSPAVRLQIGLQNSRRFDPGDPVVCVATSRPLETG